MTLFWGQLFPVLMTVLFVSDSIVTGRGSDPYAIDRIVLVTASMGVFSSALLNFPIWLGDNLYRKTYQRLQYFGLSIKKIYLSEVLTCLLVMVLNFVTTYAFSHFYYGLKVPKISYLLSFGLHYGLGMLVCLGMGVVLAVTTYQQQRLLMQSLSLLFTIYTLSGILRTFSTLPDYLQVLGNGLPTKYMANDLLMIWSGECYVSWSFICLSLVYLSVCLVMLRVLNRERKG